MGEMSKIRSGRSIAVWIGSVMPVLVLIWLISTSSSAVPEAPYLRAASTGLVLLAVFFLVASIALFWKDARRAREVEREARILARRNGALTPVGRRPEEGASARLALVLSMACSVGAQGLRIPELLERQEWMQAVVTGGFLAVVAVYLTMTAMEALRQRSDAEAIGR